MQNQFVIEPLEPRQMFSGNLISWCIAVINNWNPKSVTTQPGGYDPHISLIPYIGEHITYVGDIGIRIDAFGGLPIAA